MGGGTERVRVFYAMMVCWPNTLRASDSQSVVSGPATSSLPGKLLEMQINTDLLNQELWG